MSMGGGGGQTGGSVVAGPAPWAAQLASQYQVNAANEAAAAAERATKDAIANMNKMYQQARYDVQPYRTTGVAALNQLNQYLQLPAYNPGPAPNAPKEFTVDSIMKSLTNKQINEYLNNNVTPTSVNSAAGRAQGWAYTGYGADDAALNARIKADWESAPKHGQAFSKYPGSPGMLAIPTAINDTWLNGAQAIRAGGGVNYGILDLARRGAAQEIYDQGLEGYNTEKEAYERNLAEYNQNKSMYDKYSSEGPFTTQQITDRITQLPGYQAQLEQGVDALSKQASSRGYLGSGRLLKELNQYGQNTLSTFYGNELNRLSQLAGAGQQAATTSGQSALGTGQVNAGLYSQLGDTKANAALASGNALAQAILAANQQYKIIGQQDTGGGGLGGIGSVLGGIGSIMQSGMFSSKVLKEKINTPSPEEILNNVNSLAIDRWAYKGLENNHIGPYAEDFAEKFKVGDGKTINIIDMLGVLFSSIQALSKQVEELRGNKHAG